MRLFQEAPHERPTDFRDLKFKVWLTHVTGRRHLGMKQIHFLGHAPQPAGYNTKFRRSDCRDIDVAGKDISR